MTVVSVINYKGGVGKTTLTANIGAELAFRGRTVLLVDLDPQASLTFSFYAADEWEKSLADDKTILQWYGSLLDGSRSPLRPFVVTPPLVNNVISVNGNGRLDLLASHLELVEVDLDFAHLLGGSRFQHGSPNYLRLQRSLRDALADDAFAEYDAIRLPPHSREARLPVHAGYLIPAAGDAVVRVVRLEEERLAGSQCVEGMATTGPPEVDLGSPDGQPGTGYQSPSVTPTYARIAGVWHV